MVLQSYDECFWGGDMTSTQGYDTLIKRNIDGKKMCQELEEYLKKRSKLEHDFGKSLANLAKCFKYKEQVGQLEAAYNHIKQELDSIANSHHDAAILFSNQAEAVKSFKEEQQVKIKQLEEHLHISQNAKLNQLSQILRLEKSYMKKCFDRDMAEISFKEIDRDSTCAPKDVEKAKTRLIKAEEEAQKADNCYGKGVEALKVTTISWEKMMEKACQIVQELDESRIQYLRQGLWISVNTDSKLSLEVDNCCESVRQQLEKCDVMEDIQAFIQNASTGKSRPKRYSFKHYTVLKDPVSEEESFTSYLDNKEDERSYDKSMSGTLSRRNIMSKLKNTMKM